MAYRLTEKRLQKAMPILEEAFDLLVKTKGKASLPRSFELALCDCWNVCYKELKFIMMDMSRHERYNYLAIRYMEGGFICIPIELTVFLAEFSGLKSFDVTQYQTAMKPFWDGFIARYCSQPLPPVS